MPNVPFTPILESLKLNYTSKAICMDKLQVFHLLPFDETNRLPIKTGATLVPRFDLLDLDKEDRLQNIEGALYIALKNTAASETLSLFFQMNEPSADPYLPKATLEWAFLSGNNWEKLEEGEHILSDTTEGFIRSGIVQLVLPACASLDRCAASTVLPPEYFWLRVATAANAAATCRVAGVYTHAVHAVFQAQANDLTRLDTPLAAGSLKKMVNPLAEIKSVQQAYDTYGGLAPETDAAFYVRSSEKLRHKGRAITLSDYENLVLAAFPDIYKVKCLNHTLAQAVSQNARDKHFAAGHITLVVIPQLAHQPLAERLKPTVSRRRLADIHDFLKTRIAPFVRLSVMNPIFEEIEVTAKIHFAKGKSPAFYQNQLATQDLTRYLAPWAFDPNAKIEFGGQLIPSAILGFIEQRPYVDFVEDFTVTKKNKETSATTNSSDANGILTTKSARGIFVSGTHHITF
jgi:hypothetical protein